MSAKLMVLGFDALEATLVDRWIDEGLLPAFASLRQRGLQAELANDIPTLPDTVWVELATGRRAAKLGWYWRPEQAHAGEAELRANRPDEFDLTALWSYASDAGKRVAVVDFPSAAPADVNGVLIRDWGVHSPGFGTASWPPEILDELRAKHGAYPFPHAWEHGVVHLGCDGQDGSRAALMGVPDTLAEAIDRKRALLGDLLDREPWDLFAATFSEGHCAGHQLWHFFDETSPWYEPDAPEQLKRGVRDVYQHLDRALGELMAQAGDETTVVVLLSHGMGPQTGGWQLLPELMVRLGYTSAAAGARRAIRARLPRPVRQAIKAIVPARFKSPLKEAFGSAKHPFALSATKAAWVRCGINGAVRLNVAGRDPHGSVAPGAEYDAICADLIGAFEDLRDRDTGEPVVRRAVRTDDVYGADRHPNVPDIVVQFRGDRPVWGVTSERVGTVSEPPRGKTFPRSGDHTPHSRLWLLAPGLEPGAAPPGGDVVDVAPTLLELLGVPVPAGLDGKPLPFAQPALAQS
jgi:predicted AlkP superfamily phosphohydrolase/phosphomutase